MKKYLGKIITGVSILLALVAFFMMFAPAAVASVEVLGKTVSNSYTGSNLAFGLTESTEVLGHTVEAKIFAASANILTYILLFAGIVCAVVAILGKGGKIVSFVAMACFVAAGVLFFCSIQLCAPYTEFEGDAKKDYIKAIKESLDLGAGAIVGGVLSIVAGAAALVPIFVKSK
ncbi:MAG: hypothetical protein K2G96_01990 [Clostridia bacterium]|nr:hypothetical protein [Clostridia bacterium]